MKYELTPLHLVWNGDYYYMIGVYDYKQRMGSFRIDRIADIPEILNEEGISPPDNFNLNDYVSSTFRMFNSKREDVILECENNVMDSIIDRFGENVEVIDHKENTFSVKVNITTNSILYSWIFGFGGKVQIKSPNYAIMAYENMHSDALKHLKKENESVF
jgi:predicted DNA-binding transcriptional regulator YafY